LNQQDFDHVHPEVPSHIHPEVPEHREKPEFHRWWVGGIGGWTAPLLAAGFTVLWSLLIFFLIGERPTTWKFGVVPYVPAQSILSSQAEPRGKVPKQIEFPTAKGRPKSAER
jgi:hypothetical protein